MTKANRLTAKYVPGAGDLGHSFVLKGLPPLMKSSPACKIQGSIESLRHTIEKALYSSNFLQEDLVYVLNWLDRNIFSLASFCYLKGETTDHILPSELLSFLDDKTVELKANLGDCKDFLNQSHINLINLDGIRIEARHLETEYVNWWYSQEIISHLMGRDELIFGIRKHAAILNRLSAYLFEATRMEAKLMSAQGINVEQRHWKAGIEDFNPYN
jgi:cob(I)alamin adenosyltransferase